jgi:tRNA threonylcarbamoyl adenosine modification protein (Sua5/YciO/YrdC/YwlC family)
MKPLFWDNLETVDHVKKELREGKVVLAEGDTVLGLLADVSDKGREQLDHIKGRSKKPYLILVGTPQKAFDFIDVEREKVFQIEKIMEKCWPGPVTLIFKAKTEVASCSKSADGTVALRVPDHAGLLELLSHFDALFSTSANNAGEPVPARVQDVADSILQAVACVVMNDPQEKTEFALPSTIIDCTGDKLVVVRQGAFDINNLL